MVRKTLTINHPVYNKLRKMGFSGQTLGELIDDLCDFAKENIDEFNEFINERYDDDEDEEEY